MAYRKRNPEKTKASKKKYRGTDEGKKRACVCKNRYYARTEPQETMRYERWGVVEDCMVMDRKMNDQELASELGRSVKAIQVRRCILNKIAKS